MFGSFTVIQEYTNRNIKYGFYLVTFMDEQVLYTRNGNRVFKVSHCAQEDKVFEIRDEIAQEFLKLVDGN